jgi:60 kDa SS-A/Ro ribonucleoprotein
MGGTDCALPMLFAQEVGLEVDTFVVYTDSETWAGRMQPFEALKQYRRKMGIDAKLVVCGMVSNGFTIADPNDPGMLDVVGFDTNTPKMIAEFSKGF